jgi:hypothetical protein
MKKLILGASLLFLAGFARSQNGLENIVVEKYYVSDAIDAASATNPVPLGSITYRIYADMLPGYKLQAAYGVPAHALKLTTSTTFWNNDAATAITPGTSKTNLKNNTTMLDSWLSVGGATSAVGASGWFGILKSDDNGVATVVNAETPKVVQNNDASAGIAVKTQDGIISTTAANPVQAVTLVGIGPEGDVFLDGTANGPSFVTNNGSWASLSGSVGPDGNNRVLIAQITTDGVFHYELNVQIGTPTGGTQNFVANTPTGAEISIASLSGTLNAVNALPTVSITSPANGAGFVIGSSVAIAATAADADGSVVSVEFFDGATSLGIDNTSPYTGNIGSVSAGAHALTAKATDDLGGQKTSTVVTINGVSNPAPTVNITTPTNGASFTTGDVVNIGANAADDISVASVEFFVDAVSVGIDNSSPYTATYTSTVGAHNLTAKATDNLGATTTSAIVAINVANNVAPTVSVTAPANGASGFPGVVTINATAADADGSVTGVEFFVGAISLGIDATSPYSINWTSTSANVGVNQIKAKATDNRGAVTTSSIVNYEVLDASIPYKVGTITEKCLVGTFCVPVTATSAVSNVTGFDMVLHYNKTKVTPTGRITKGTVLLDSNYVTIAKFVDSGNGLVNISVYLNSNAPVTASFNGTGDIFCVEFTKTVAFLSADQSLFSVTSFVESYPLSTSAKLVADGKIVLYQDTTFVGKLQFWKDTTGATTGNRQPIVYDKLNPSQYLISNVYGSDASCVLSAAAAVQPDLSGIFNYNIVNGHSISISRDIANIGQPVLFSIIGGNDAFKTSQVTVNDPSYTPTVFEMMAMDVNMDGKVSAGDISQISQRSVRTLLEFKQVWNAAGTNPSKDWLFVDSLTLATAPYTAFSKSAVPVAPFCLSLPVADYNCPDMHLAKYTGVLLGDVDGSYAGIAHDGKLKKLANPTAVDKVIFDLSKAVVKDGYIDVPVSVSSTDAVNSLDFALQFNENNLNYQSVINHAGDVSSVINYVQDDKTLNFSSYSMNKYNTNGSIVSLRFAISSTQVNANDISSIQAYVNGKPVKAEITTGIANMGAENLVSIYPNPATDMLNIHVSERSTIQLFDMSGKVVVEGTIVNANEKQSISTENIAAGIYMMKVSNDNFVTMKKVVVNK